MSSVTDGCLLTFKITVRGHPGLHDNSMSFVRSLFPYLASHPDLGSISSWGAVHLRMTIVGLFVFAKRMLLSILDVRFGGHSIPIKDFPRREQQDWCRYHIIPFKKALEHGKITCNQISQAVELLQICGLNWRYDRKMWTIFYEAEFIHISPLLMKVGNSTRTDRTSDTPWERARFSTLVPFNLCWPRSSPRTKVFIGTPLVLYSA